MILPGEGDPARAAEAAARVEAAKRAAAKCLHCGEPVLGSFYPHDDDGKYQQGGKHKVHSACYDDYRKRNGH